MIDIIWTVFMLGGIILGALLGRMDMVTQGIISGGKSAVELAFTMAGVIGMWAGVLKIAEEAGMVRALARKMQRLMDWMFPTVPRDNKAREYIATNFVANFLGLGWAATPAGLMAIKELQKLNHDKQTASPAMCMFLVVNMSSLQLVTINILAYRTQFASHAPAEIVGAGIVATTISTVVGMLSAKAMERRQASAKRR